MDGEQVIVPTMWWWSDDVLEVIGTDSTDGRTAYSMVGLLMEEEESARVDRVDSTCVDDIMGGFW